MQRFEMNFKNPVVRVWFYTVFPTIFIAILLLLILPVEYHNSIILFKAFVIVVFWIWYLFNKKKRVTH
ncbi:hypothetical protein [Ureibacillus chungkukjangi]|uniref:Uncharacterized protein n=1 Tax=Ureibacillus chungkukjangi TaxID=1202712 RepID=A0A318TKG7_9BACL|nr:hypothetical protein [Ureibacillus chungkukjangi]MCM3389378.1 hypothetical protein [Ureibacillus chungkukjangi]PYF05144.1 hypothetical protein BJ095_11918 [Ureibacillus chungkukjangi]